jgi:hypothetical protein
MIAFKRGILSRLEQNHITGRSKITSARNARRPLGSLLAFWGRVHDQREFALNGYEEIVDHDMSNSAPILAEPGDVLVFHSDLMHRSTDNESESVRAAVVWHYAQSETRDLTSERFGFQNPTHDFMPITHRNRARAQNVGPSVRFYALFPQFYSIVAARFPQHGT